MIIIIAVFIFVTIMLLVIGFYYSRSQALIKQRLENVIGEIKTWDEELQIPFLQRVLAPLSNRVARFVREYMPVRVMQRTQERLAMANLELRLTPTQFQSICSISGVVGFCLMFLALQSSSIAHAEDGTVKSSLAILYMAVGMVGGYFIPQLLLSQAIKKRQEVILLALPYALDLLSITVEAGLGFDASLTYVMRNMTGPLSEEFAKSLNEIRLGKPRLEAFDDLGERTGVEDLKIFMTAIVHASKLGASITNTLRIQSDSLRSRRRQRLQAMALKAPVKMTFPLVLFIFPVLIIVVGLPALLSFVVVLGK